MVKRLSKRSQYERLEREQEWNERSQSSSPIEINLPHSITICATGLNIPPDVDVDLDQWSVIGRRLAAIDNGVRWALGDWYAHGYHKYGKKKFEAVANSIGYEFDSLMNLGYVARNVAPSLRNEALSWSHHNVVAKLAPQEQELWLKKATAMKWSVRKLVEMMHERSSRDRDDNPNLRARDWAEAFTAKAQHALPLNGRVLLDRTFVELLDEHIVETMLASARRVSIVWADAVTELETLQEERTSKSAPHRERLHEETSKLSTKSRRSISNAELRQ